MSKAEGTRAMRAMGGSEKKEKGKSDHKVHKMEIRHGASGGYIVTHHQKPKAESMMSGAQEPQEHVIPDAAALQQHVAQNMGDSEPAPAASPDQAAGAAQAAPDQGEPQ